MYLFEFDKTVRNKSMEINASDTQTAVRKYLEYIHKEEKKGRIPLIVVGAGISSSNVVISDKENSTNLKGLPTLIEMINKIKEYLNEEDEKKDLSNLLEMFSGFDDSNSPPNYIDREWLSKLFTTMENSELEQIRKIWDKFCNWFLFECINGQHGAINTLTTTAATEIWKFSMICNALCFSANFDNYLAYNFGKTSETKNKTFHGMSIFSRSIAEQYFKRSSKTLINEKTPVNNCVFHANGDVFWLSCSGDATDGFCPKKDKYLPAFSWFNLNDKDKKISKDDLVCDICTSRLHATMTMPGTYKKDHDTRKMIGALWKYVSSRISTVITVGISCNWDDVLLKFIIGLLFENKIPHFNINKKKYDKNKRPEKKIDKIEILEKIVYDDNFSSFSITGDADSIIEYLNTQYKEIIDNKKSNIILYKDIFNDNGITNINELFSNLKFIQQLEKVKQLGLKGFWKYTPKEMEMLGLDATNNRWKHSKLVAKTALEYYRKIKKNPIVSEEVLIYISGLLHDCGHLPFSHLLEEVFSELSWKFENNEESFKHGHYTSYLIRNLFNSDDTSEDDYESKEKIKKLIEENNIDYEDIIKVINGNYGIGYIDALINSEIDCDKIAYLFGDSEETNVKLLLNRTEFLDKLTENAFITRENFIAIESESAWIAFRLLDERKRLFNELYFASDLRFLEAATKFILTTYFVQHFNKLDEKEYIKYINKKDDNEKYGDLSHFRIKMVIDDFFNIINTNNEIQLNIKYSLSEHTHKALDKCMELCMKPIDRRKGTPRQEEFEEIKILKVIYKRLTGVDFIEKESIKANYLPYSDKDIDDLSKDLSYKKLLKIRKRIHLNFPGILLIDVYQSVKYLSTAKTREKHLRIDGTEENQVVYLVPSSNREIWLNSKTSADVDITEYVKNYKLDVRKCIFNVYKLSDDNSKVEHAINMLKKEMKIYNEPGNEVDDD